MSIFNPNQPFKPKKVWLVKFIGEGMDFRVDDRIFTFKCDAQRYCNYKNSISEETYYSFEEIMIY